MEIRYDRVSKTYPNSAAPAVQAVSLTIPAGQLAVFLGTSGCGKTTLLKMTNRLIEPSEGAIWFDDQDIRGMEVTALRRRIGYVIQQVGLFPHLTVAKNIAIVPELMHWPRETIRARVDELLRLVHLDPSIFRDRYPAQLSGGQQQRVGLARALAADPEVLLMDEPFGAIDAITRLRLQEELLQLQRRLRKTVLFVTHDVEEALRLADMIIVLRAGQVVQSGPPYALLSRPADDFVRDLLGAGDRVRLLGLVRAGTVMEPLTAADEEGALPAVDADDSLRDALALFLHPGVRRVLVLRGGRPAGALTLDHLRGVGATQP